MKLYSKSPKIMKFFTIEKQSGEIFNVKNMHQVAVALNATYCFVWKKLKQLDDPGVSWVTVKNCIIRKVDIELPQAKREANEQKSV